MFMDGDIRNNGITIGNITLVWFIQNDLPAESRTRAPEEPDHIFYKAPNKVKPGMPVSIPIQSGHER